MTGTIERTRRSDYRRFQAISTRWMDNDVYGHVNNVVYYAWFDTAVNRLLVVNGLLFWLTSWIAGLLDLPFVVDNFWPSALLGALIVGVASWLINMFVDKD